MKPSWAALGQRPSEQPAPVEKAAPRQQPEHTVEKAFIEPKEENQDEVEQSMPPIWNDPYEVVLVDDVDSDDEPLAPASLARMLAPPLAPPPPPRLGRTGGSRPPSRGNLGCS